MNKGGSPPRRSPELSEHSLRHGNGKPSSASSVSDCTVGGQKIKFIAYDHIGVLGTHVHLTEDSPSAAIRTYRAYRTHAPAYHHLGFGPSGSSSKLVPDGANDANKVDEEKAQGSVDESLNSRGIFRLFSMFDVVLIALCLLLQIPAVHGGGGSELAAPATLVVVPSQTHNLVDLPTTKEQPTQSVSHQHSLSTPTFGGGGWIPEARHFFATTFPIFVCRSIETLLSELVRLLAWMLEIAAGSEGAAWLTRTTTFQTVRFHGGFYHSRICAPAGPDSNAPATLCPGSSWLAPTVAQPSTFWPLLFMLCVLVRIPIRMARIAVEEVMVIDGVGLQLTTRDFSDRVVKEEFIDISRIRGVVLHEAYFRHRVIFVLGLLIEGQEGFKVLFEESLPRLAPLKKVLIGIRGVLYHEPTEGQSLAEIGAAAAALAAHSKKQ